MRGLRRVPRYPSFLFKSNLNWTSREDEIRFFQEDHIIYRIFQKVLQNAIDNPRDLLMVKFTSPNCLLYFNKNKP